MLAKLVCRRAFESYGEMRTSLWTPFAQGTLWRYRKADQST